MVVTNGIKEFLERIRDERTKRLGISSFIIGMDGIKGAGKSTHQLPKLEEELRRRDLNPNKFRATSIYRSDERRDYCREIVLTLEEDLDKSLELYIKDIKKAWEETILPIAKRDGVILLDRTPYTTLAIQLERRKVQINSHEARDLAERIFPYPIIPPHVEIITVCTPQIALDRTRERESEVDVMSQYYKTAYARAHDGEQISDDEMQLWWLDATKNMYERLFRLIPNATLVHTGRKSNELNTEVQRAATRGYDQYKRKKKGS